MASDRVQGFIRTIKDGIFGEFLRLFESDCCFFLTGGKQTKQLCNTCNRLKQKYFLSSY